MEQWCVNCGKETTMFVLTNHHDHTCGVFVREVDSTSFPKEDEGTSHVTACSIKCAAGLLDSLLSQRQGAVDEGLRPPFSYQGKGELALTEKGRKEAGM
jgi:hypothetical protein